MHIYIGLASLELGNSGVIEQHDCCTLLCLYSGLLKYRMRYFLALNKDGSLSEWLSARGNNY
jgi:hypothetical protein